MLPWAEFSFAKGPWHLKKSGMLTLESISFAFLFSIPYHGKNEKWNKLLLNPKTAQQNCFPKTFQNTFWFQTVKLTVHWSQTQFNGQKSIGKWCPSDEEMDDRRLSTPVQAWEARLVPKLPCYRTPSAPHAKRTCFVVGVVVVAGLICRSALNPHNCL
jgi:hypothetical protein